MFAALSENSAFFEERVNLFMMLAPAVTVTYAGDVVQEAARNETLINILKGLGPEVMTKPNIDGSVSSAFFKIAPVKFGIG